jgi:hypothetical protein
VFSARHELNLLHIMHIHLRLVLDVPWLRQLVADPAPRRPEFDPRSMLWNLWWTEWQWGKVLYEYFRFCPSVSIHQSTIRSYQINGRNLGTFQTQLVPKIVAHWNRKAFSSKALKSTGQLRMPVKKQAKPTDWITPSTCRLQLRKSSVFFFCRVNAGV